MSSPQGEKKECDVEMSNAAPLATTPDPLPSDGALAGFLSFRDKVLPRAEGQVGADALAQPSGSSTTPVPTDDKEHSTESMPPPPARRGIVLALRAPSATPVAPPKGRKRRCTRRNNGESSQQGGSSLMSGYSAKDTHSAEVSQLEAQIGGLGRDLGKTVSSLLKEKQARKVKSSEVPHLQNQIQSGGGSKSSDAEMAADVLRAEFQTCLAKIAVFLDSLVTVHDRDLALANVDGSISQAQLFKNEEILSPLNEEARLLVCKEELATVDGDFGLFLTAAKLECGSFPCPGEPEGQDPAVGEDEGGAVPSLDEVVVEGEA
ncbi:hypothetical protein F2Q69_00006857 [Brassica cretica]|uniref:Uncharacterized protein n=1 Tax=Brassica cretica TaxID=69181 RepID=A0A8S9PIC7_BRACR|nr:hypothetical protein F2Q69_00006857 [Brassica cretica]